MSSTRLSLSPPPANATDVVGALAHRADGLSKIESRAVIGVIAGAHVFALWGLLQIDAVREAVRDVAPLMIDLVTPPKPEQPPPPPPPPPPRPIQRTPRPVVEPPLIAAPPTVPAPAETFGIPAPPPEPVPTVVAAPPAPPAPPAPAPAPPPPAAPRTVPPSAVAYLVPPTGEMPRLSRRAREQGTVWLHVVVDTQGLPSQIRVSRSSGYARLDDHAVEAMRKARFKPYAVNGVAIEIQVTTPIEYSLDN